jgi:hypothetical protein
VTEMCFKTRECGVTVCTFVLLQGKWPEMKEVNRRLCKKPPVQGVKYIGVCKKPPIWGFEYIG